MNQYLVKTLLYINFLSSLVIYYVVYYFLFKIMICTQTLREMSKPEIAFHRAILKDIGATKASTFINDDGEQIQAHRFVDELKSYLDYKHFEFNNTPHLPFSTQATNTPTMSNFHDILWKVRNVVLSRLFIITEACATDQQYRDKFLHNSCNNGTISPFDQACEYFMTEYLNIQRKYESIITKFENISTKQSYIDVLNEMLDWRYCNRQPSMTPWNVWPKAKIHENDVALFSK